jgi:gliding motility-associated-like protein
MNTPGRLLVLILFTCCFYLPAAGQCLTDFTKVLPEPSTDYSSNFGQSFSVYDDVIAVGVPYNDSLGRLTGVVNIYRRQTGSTWQKIATVAPSDPMNSLAFGTSVKLSANYLAVGAAGYGGKVYIFKKPAGEWESVTEDFKLTHSGSQAFGVSMRDPIAISDDELTIAIVDQYEHISYQPSLSGAIYVYHRQPADEWSDHAAARIAAPGTDVVDFGRTGVYIVGDRIATATPFCPTGYGCAFIFRDSSGHFTNLTLEATLTATPAGSGTGNIGFSPLLFVNEGIVAFAGINYNNDGAGGKTGLVFFKKPASNVWTNTEPTCTVDIMSGQGLLTGNLSLSTNGTDIYAGYADADNNGHFGVLKKGTNDWCNPAVEDIDVIDAESGNYVNLYGIRSAANGSNAVVGVTTLPDNPNAPLAIKAFHNNGTNWSSSLLYDSRKNTGGHFFGTSVLTLNDHMFVGAPQDGTVKNSGGAVYTYRKLSGSWVKTGKIVVPALAGRNDDGFGYALATNGAHLAVGAPGFGNSGKILIYERTGSDWMSAVLTQQIAVPADRHPDVYGDYLAMTDKWLVVPFQQNTPNNRVHVAIYERKGTQWEFFQVVETEYNPFFARGSTFPVDIEGETIIASSYIIERNADGKWGIKGELRPANPEPMRIAPDFSHWVSNGERFGYSVDIQGDFIFIGAPQKDFGSVWDVGAVYVFARRPGFAWSSMTETTIIFPRVKEERELFGWSINSLGNTLIVGAPGADYKKDEVTARNKPGRAYIFQSMDYYWKDVLALMDFTGDSFTKDYFGLAVSLDGSNFIIGASIEDIPTGLLSGSVYVAPSPPIVKLVPPTCLAYAEVQLVGYPFGGTWSGPGLKSAGSGIFIPSVAGIGTHEFEYTTPSCAYTGKLVIEVVAPPKMTPVTPANVSVCKETGFSKKLEVSRDAAAYYSWHYRAPGSPVFEEIGERASSMTANKRGEYYVAVYNAGCTLISPIINVHDEDIDVEIEELPAVCAKANSSIALKATPEGGTWSGSGVSASRLSTNNPGGYHVTYIYKSPAGCTYSETTTVLVKAAYSPVINRVNGNLCENGQVMLGLNDVPGDAVYGWQFKAEHSNTWQPLGISQANIIAKENGSYLVTTGLGNCSSQSNIFELNDRMTVALNPNADDLTVCFGSTATLSTNLGPGTAIQWNYASTLQAFPEELSTGGILTVSKDGYYFAEAKRGVCNAVSKPIHVILSPRDTLAAPNVFTPNGDGKNERFTVKLGAGGGEINVFNRYGKPVFSGNRGSEWDGGEHPTGVYFWIATVKGCEGEERTAKGYVHLIR